MIFENNQSSANHILNCNQLVGEPFSFLDRISMGKLSSPALKLVEFSAAFGTVKPNSTLQNNVQVEIRPKGIIVIFKKNTHEFYWVVPFYKLNLYSATFLSIHADGHFMRFEKDYSDYKALPFFKKLHQLKVESMPPGSDYFDY